MATSYHSPVGASIPFDNTGSSLVSVIVDDAIKEIASQAENSSRAFTFCSYTGNANTGRYLEFFPGIDSSVASLFTPVSLKVLTIVSGVIASGTFSIGFYGGATLLYSVTHTASKQVVLVGTPASPLFTIPSNAYLSIKISSGSANKPHLYFVCQGG